MNLYWLGKWYLSVSAYEASSIVGTIYGQLEKYWSKVHKCWQISPRIWSWDLNTSVRNNFDLIHQTSRLIGMIYFQIQVILPQEKKLELGLFRARRSKVPKLHSTPNWLGKQDISASEYEALRFIVMTSAQFETLWEKVQKCWPISPRI